MLADADQRLLTAADQYRLELELLGQSFDGAAAMALATGERVNRLGDFVREPRGFRVVGEEWEIVHEGRGSLTPRRGRVPVEQYTSPAAATLSVVVFPCDVAPE